MAKMIGAIRPRQSRERAGSDDDAVAAARGEGNHFNRSLDFLSQLQEGCWETNAEILQSVSN